MSLPYAFGTRLDSIPNLTPYLTADPARAKPWRAKLPSTDGARRIGLSWAGRPQHQYDRERSITLSMLAHLSKTQGARFFGLQKGDAAQQCQNPPPGLELIDYSSELHDFADTAALISQLDLVISVDTAVAHVAAALGKPVWLLLAAAPDWRWLLDRADSPWYPTMRLFRQQARGDWVPAIEQLARELNAASAVARAEW